MFDELLEGKNVHFECISLVKQNLCTINVKDSWLHHPSIYFSVSKLKSFTKLTAKTRIVRI